MKRRFIQWSAVVAAITFALLPVLIVLLMGGCKNFGKTTYETPRAQLAHQIGVEYGALNVSMDAFTVAAQLGQVSNEDLIKFRDTKNRILTVLNEASDSVEANNLIDAQAKLSLVSQLAATIDLLVDKYPAAKKAKENRDGARNSDSDHPDQPAGGDQRREVRRWGDPRPVYTAGDHRGAGARGYALGTSADERQERCLRSIRLCHYQWRAETRVIRRAA